MSITDLVAIGVDKPKIDSACSLEKYFIKLFYINACMVMYLIVNQVDSCHDYAYNPLIGDTKDICGWMTLFWLWLAYP